MSDMKRCRKCGEVKALDAFPVRSCTPDGRHGFCRECKRRRQREWEDANREHIRQKARESDRRRYSDNPEKFREKSRKTHHKNRDKNLEKMAKNRKDLTDAYVKRSLLQGLPTMRGVDVPQSLLEMKREQIALQRLKRELLQEISNQLEKRNGN